MDFVSDVRNELLKRREVNFKISSGGNPGFEGARKNVVEGMKVPEENVVVKFVKNNFGANEFLVEAFVYDSAEHKDLFEPKAKGKKKAGGN